MDQERRIEKKNKIKTLDTERCVNIDNLYINKIIIIIIFDNYDQLLRF